MGSRRRRKRSSRLGMNAPGRAGRLTCFVTSCRKISLLFLIVILNVLLQIWVYSTRKVLHVCPTVLGQKVVSSRCPISYLTKHHQSDVTHKTPRYTTSKGNLIVLFFTKLLEKTKTIDIINQQIAETKRAQNRKFSKFSNNASALSLSNNASALNLSATMHQLYYSAIMYQLYHSETYISCISLRKNASILSLSKNV